MAHFANRKVGVTKPVATRSCGGFVFVIRQKADDRRGDEAEQEYHERGQRDDEGGGKDTETAR